jgi:aspartate carbamoyltransferase catalytic subunit
MKPKPIKSLLAIEPLAPEQIAGLLEAARRMDLHHPRPLLKGRRVALLFYEASTRTRVSFEIAAKALGAHTTVITAAASSIEKGESLIDTGRTLRAIGADLIVIRHPSSGAPQLLARDLDISIVNAGDGMHEHPSQGLLDAFTILQHQRSLKGLNIVTVGDIYHSRVARSDVHLFTKMGANVTLCGPEPLLPATAHALAPGIRLEYNMDKAIAGADVVMMLRVQKERLAGLEIEFGEYIGRYQLTAERLRKAKKDALVMHPGPMIRGMELTDEVADGAQSVVTEQVANGVKVRMALLSHLLPPGRGGNGAARTRPPQRAKAGAPGTPRGGRHD